MRARVAGFSELIRGDRAEGVVHSLPEARISGGTGGDLAFQRAATGARGLSRLLAPHVLPVGGKIVFLREKEISHGGFGTKF